MRPKLMPVLLMSALLVACPQVTQPEVFLPGKDFVAGELIAVTRKDVSASSLMQSGRNIGFALGSFYDFPGQGTRICGQQLVNYTGGSASYNELLKNGELLKDAGGFFTVNPNVLYYDMSQTSRVQALNLNPLAAVTSWGYAAVGAESRFRATGVKVAVIDTGVTNHGDFNETDAVNTLIGSSKREDANDDFGVDGHGTAVASIIASKSARLPGVAQEAVIMPIKACDKDGKCTGVSVALAVCFAVSKEAKVINLSLGSMVPSDIVLDAIKDAIDAGSLVVVSAGNTADDAESERRNAPSYPAADSPKVDGLIAVGAIDEDLQPASFTTTGSYVDIAAPGVEVIAQSKNSLRSFFLADGTSFAAPYVSGTAALMIAGYNQRGYYPSPPTLEKMLKQSAKAVSESCDQEACGAGIVNIAQALSLE